MKPHEKIFDTISRGLDQAHQKCVEKIVAQARPLNEAALEKIEDWRNHPDQRIGTNDDPYLDRWFIIKKNRWFNIYLHHFHRSDDDRALHDHPWLFNMSWVLKGGYSEIKFADKLPRVLPTSGAYDSGESLPATMTVAVPEGTFKIRWGRAPHRVVLKRLNKIGWRFGKRYEQDVWTLFITGPKVFEWGFWCPKRRVPWRRFTGADGMRGQGCSEG